MSQPYRPFEESKKPVVERVKNWFTVGKTAALVVGALVAGEIGWVLVGDARDAQQATTLIAADGFKASGVDETVGGDTVDINSLRVGRCVFNGVEARLTFGESGVTDVSDYQVQLADGNANAIGTVTVQNAAGLEHSLPNLNC